MKFDKFLAKLFSKGSMAILGVIVSVSMMLSSCICTEDDVILCLFCGCITPDTACNICDNVCNSVNGCMCDCAEDCSDSYWDSVDNSAIGKGASCFSGCLADCFTNEEGDPIDCEDVGCPECQKYFECE